MMESILLIGNGSDTFLGDVLSWDGTQWTEIPTSNTPFGADFMLLVSQSVS